ncbi:serine/threonine-protein kinase [Allostreptomyces psammosilenae]|uniref:non-specific serine/threonine protein kinase n=1 Tax=Allostreptomyces psammosilenae TaxID=1892865 RepID=A0A852ZY97_9ACTN|nr:serine/threonine-protein kinase [Allostreptomyces psammosilenae]NYI06200.1 serine/threonine-protein kinase [Allostreptomyces psammosilenae]
MRPVGSKYLLQETLGRGATGTVWRAEVRDGGEAVAIKVLREELANDPDVVMRFLRERSVLLRLTHPNIVRVRDLVVEGDLLALVMDLVEGPDLHRYLRGSGPMSPVGGALLTAQIADALAASHADGVVHRDLKPANVLLAVGGGPDSVMRPMLTDFGIARLADSPGITRAHEFVGTPAYVAPETAEGREQTSAVDVYAAGIVLHELLTGQPPFTGDGPMTILHRHLTEEPRRPATVPDPLWTVIERCLRKRPEERPDAVSLARALRVVADGLAATASPEQIEAAAAVGALLVPVTAPVVVPGTGVGGDPGDHGVPGSQDPTMVAPTTPPDGATRVYSGSAGLDGDPFRERGGPVAAGSEDRTQVMPAGAHPAGPGGPSGSPAADQNAPHPWQTQLDAARHRAEQTEVYPWVEGETPDAGRGPGPGGYPGAHPGAHPGPAGPPRGVPGPPQGAQPSAPYGPAPGAPDHPGGGYPGGYPDGGGYPGAGHPQAAPGDRAGYGYPPQAPVPGSDRRPRRARQDYPPAPPPAPVPAPAPAPVPAPQPERRPEPRPRREPAEPVEPRRQRAPRQRMRLGCAGGCLRSLLVMAVIVVLVWWLTPVPEWIATGIDWWNDFTSWVSDVWRNIQEFLGLVEEVQGNVDDLQQQVDDLQQNLPTDLPELPQDLPQTG